MKKIYSMPEFVAIELEEKDIITLSNDDLNDNVNQPAEDDNYAPQA